MVNDIFLEKAGGNGNLVCGSTAPQETTYRFVLQLRVL